MTPGTLWHLRGVTNRDLRGHVYIDAPRWFLAREYASRFFAAGREDVELVVVPDGEPLQLPCRVISATPKGALVVSRRRVAAKALNGAGGSSHE